MKKEIGYNWCHRDPKEHKRTIWTIICQKYGQHRRNGIPRHIYLQILNMKIWIDR